MNKPEGSGGGPRRTTSKKSETAAPTRTAADSTASVSGQKKGRPAGDGKPPTAAALTATPVDPSEVITRRSATIKRTAKPSPSPRISAGKSSPAKAATPPSAAGEPAAAPVAKPKPAAKPSTSGDRPARLPAAKRDAHADRVWELARRIRICMFITWDGERQRARPLVAIAEEQDHAVYFLTDAAGHADWQAERFPVVTLAFADPAANRYLAISGTADVLNDRDLIRRLWSPFARAWWQSADDPDIRAIKVTPQDAELWESPGGLLSRVAMLAAAAVRGRPRIGDNAKVPL